jgi:hypothetical protein
MRTLSCPLPLVALVALVGCSSPTESSAVGSAAIETPAQQNAQWGDPRDFSAPKYEAALRAALKGQTLTMSRDVTATFTEVDPTQAVATGHIGHFPDVVTMTEGRSVNDFWCDFVVAATGDDQLISSGAKYALTTTSVTGRQHPYPWGGWSIAFEVDGSRLDGDGPTNIHVNCFNANGSVAGTFDRYYFEL